MHIGVNYVTLLASLYHANFPLDYRSLSHLWGESDPLIWWFAKGRKAPEEGNVDHWDRFLSEEEADRQKKHKKWSKWIEMKGNKDVHDITFIVNSSTLQCFLQVTFL